MVDPVSREAKALVGGAIVGAHPVEKRRLVILNHQNIAFEAIGVGGRVWLTPRLSWDGFKDVSVDSETIRGFGWESDHTWHRFEVDIATGRSSGGAAHILSGRASESQ